MNRLDIAIAGCGPAGLAVALFLERAGHRITLFDQMGRPAPVGSGLILQPTGLGVLDELGLLDETVRRGARIERLFGRVVPSGRVVLDVRYGALAGQPHGVALHRSSLFEVLFGAVMQAGIAIETQCRVAAAERAADHRVRLVSENGRSFGPFDLVVDALGARSKLASAARLDAGGKMLLFGALWSTLPFPGAPFADDALEQRYKDADVMIGVLPIGTRAGGSGPEAAFFWSLKPEDYALWRGEGLEAWKARVLAVWPETLPLVSKISDPDQMVLAQYAHVTLPSPAGASVARIGDAAHATSPQLGQGANMALLDAWALALALEWAADLNAALVSYARMRGFHVRLYQAISAVFTPFYQSDSKCLPFLRDWLFAPASRLPLMPGFLAKLVAGTLVAPLAGGGR